MQEIFKEKNDQYGPRFLIPYLIYNLTRRCAAGLFGIIVQLES